MAISETSIANMALARIGAKRVNDIDTSPSEEGIQCRTHYEQARDSLLRSHAWRFAIGRSTLSADTTAPEFEWAYQYILPVDCLRVIDLYDSENSFALEGDRLLTNDNSASILYVRRITDPTKFDSMFVEILVLALALRIVMPLAQDLKLRREIQDELREIVSKSKLVNLNETSTKNKPELITWLDARLTIT